MHSGFVNCSVKICGATFELGQASGHQLCPTLLSAIQGTKSRISGAAMKLLDNETRKGLDKFLEVASDEPESVHYKVCAG
ncbi:hypothetical protein Peur_005135 [Populus x canadensis]